MRNRTCLNLKDIFESCGETYKRVGLAERLNYDVHSSRCDIGTTHVSFSRSVVSPEMRTLHNGERSSEWSECQCARHDNARLWLRDNAIRLRHATSPRHSDGVASTLHRHRIDDGRRARPHRSGLRARDAPRAMTLREMRFELAGIRRSRASYLADTRKMSRRFNSVSQDAYEADRAFAAAWAGHVITLFTPRMAFRSLAKVNAAYAFRIPSRRVPAKFNVHRNVRIKSYRVLSSGTDNRIVYRLSIAVDRVMQTAAQIFARQENWILMGDNFNDMQSNISISRW